MPITDTRNILTFVNQLEAKIIQLQSDISGWNQNKSQLLSAVSQVERNRVQATSAIVKAEDALAELNTATYGVVAAKGQRLKKLLDDLKDQVVEIAERAAGAGIPEYLSDEINNAISSVDSVVSDGLKLDYRLRKIQEIGQAGLDFSNKQVIMPYKHVIEERLTTDQLTIPPEEGILFVSGEVTVLDETGSRGILNGSNSLITGQIDETGKITLSDAPMQPVRLYFPVQMKFNDIPDDFLFLLVETIVSKASPIMESLMRIEKTMSDILNDIVAMKGSEWTADFSIMRNHKELVKEGITPKGLGVQVIDGIVHVTFSYNDHPQLSHFILEKWDEETGDWRPYDGAEGIVMP